MQIFSPIVVFYEMAALWPNEEHVKPLITSAHGVKYHYSIISTSDTGTSYYFIVVEEMANKEIF